MAASDVVSVRGQVMEYTYIPIRIKGEMVRSGVDCHWMGIHPSRNPLVTPFINSPVMPCLSCVPKHLLSSD